MTDDPIRRRASRPATIASASFAVFLLLVAGSFNVDAATVPVKARNFTFQPAALSINIGDVVGWTFSGDPHTVTSGSPGAPDGAFDSGIKDPGTTFQVTFKTPGTFHYFCQIHPEQMIGTIVVEAGVTPKPTATPAPKSTATPAPKPTATPTATATATVTATEPAATATTAATEPAATTTIAATEPAATATIAPTEPAATATIAPTEPAATASQSPPASPSATQAPSQPATPGPDAPASGIFGPVVAIVLAIVVALVVAGIVAHRRRSRRPDQSI